MPRTYTCSFCGKSFISGEGMMHVRTDGVVLRFCSSKCRRSMLDFGRDARKFKWTEHYAQKPQ